MNIFDEKLREKTRDYPLKAKQIKILTTNMGYKCHLGCPHCYTDYLAGRSEEMSLSTIDKILNILKNNSDITTLYILGGAPELNPNIKYFLKSAADMGKKVMLNSNLASYAEPGMKDFPAFLAENSIDVITYLSCYSERCYTKIQDGYTEEGLDTQRGRGAYKKIMDGIKKLNGLGYGQEDSSLSLDLVFHPGTGCEKLCRDGLEKDYKKQLYEMQGVLFNKLQIMNTFPIGLLKGTISDNEKSKYIKELEKEFNPCSVGDLMCRYSISFAHNEKIYHCDFWQLLKSTVNNGEVHIGNINDFDYETIANREIATSPNFCFLCTAGAGCSDINRGEIKVCGGE